MVAGWQDKTGHIISSIIIVIMIFSYGDESSNESNHLFILCAQVCNVCLRDEAMTFAGPNLVAIQANPPAPLNLTPSFAVGGTVFPTLPELFSLPTPRRGRMSLRVTRRRSLHLLTIEFLCRISTDQQKGPAASLLAAALSNDVRAPISAERCDTYRFLSALV